MLPRKLVLLLVFTGAIVLCLSTSCKKKKEYIYLTEPAGTYATEAAADMVVPRYNHNCIRLANGKVLVVCGTLAGGKQKLRCAELYDPATAAFSIVSSKQIDTDWRGNHERSYASGVCGMSGTGGRYYFIAGFGPSEIYDADCNSFTKVPALPDNGSVFPGGWEDFC
ncbi:MAG: hypothetical protein E3J72_00460 [Planctomycetota bacterium]|nr:MAG: hypothetical protein E3J72_00460 [Planctomycetota bacterium]